MVLLSLHHMHLIAMPQVVTHSLKTPLLLISPPQPFAMPYDIKFWFWLCCMTLLSNFFNHDASATNLDVSDHDDFDVIWLWPRSNVERFRSQLWLRNSTLTPTAPYDFEADCALWLWCQLHGTTIFFFGLTVWNLKVRKNLDYGTKIMF